VEALTGSRMFIASCLMTREDMYTLMPGADALVEFDPNLNPGWGQNRTICGVPPPARADACAGGTPGGGAADLARWPDGMGPHTQVRVGHVRVCI
jgi:hypothetical protein